MNIKIIIGVVIIAIFVVWGATAFMETTVQYVSLEKAAQSTRTVQVMGKVDFDLVKYSTDHTRLEFAVYDVDAENEVTATRLPVHFYGVVPGNFDQATSVVLKGKVGEAGGTDDGVFVADQMLVKCPSKYQGEEGQYQDPNKHDEAVGDV